MKLFILIAILAGFALLALGVVVSLYHHKKAGSGDFKLVGELAHVEVELNPEGTVIVCGELWRAKSNHGIRLPPRTRVRVVGVEGLLILVEPYD